jgi:hypothetical protein
MPDLFASLAACRDDETADASVVNVTGSNSVNVFLGLGVPWSVCSLYWFCKERTSQWTACYPEAAARLDADGQGSSMVFVVESGYIGFSVMSFCCVCLSAVAVLMLRRKYLHAELGGPFVPKVTSGVVLISFWFAWISLVCWRVLRYENQTLFEQGVVGIAFLSLVLLGMMIVFASVYKHRLTEVQVREAREVRRFSMSSTQGLGEQSVELDQPSAQGTRVNDKSSGELTKDSDRNEHTAAPPSDVVVEGV